MSPALAGGFINTEPPGKPTCLCQLLFIHFRLLLSLWTWDIGIGIICFLITFRGIAPSNLRKTFLSCKTGKRLREDLPLVGARKSLQLQIFWGKCSKEKDVEFYPLEETCLKFSQAERNVKAGLVSILQTLHSWGAELSVISKEGRLEYYRII